MFGVDHNDPIEDAVGRTRTNHAGGVVGGITNGNELVFRIAIKPTSSTPKEQVTLNWETGEQEVFSVKGRHDLCIALRVPPVLEAVTAIVLADLALVSGKLGRIVEEPIFHITTAEAIKNAELTGFLEADSLQSEGFIHCSEAWQLPGVIERFYKGVEGLQVVEIQPGKLTSKLVYEKATDAEDWFPHVYGAVNLDAVVSLREG
jgi:uncharacterized protein (DUF952 family)